MACSLGVTQSLHKVVVDSHSVVRQDLSASGCYSLNLSLDGAGARRAAPVLRCNAAPSAHLHESGGGEFRGGRGYGRRGRGGVWRQSGASAVAELDVLEQSHRSFHDQKPEDTSGRSGGYWKKHRKHMKGGRMGEEGSVHEGGIQAFADATMADVGPRRGYAGVEADIDPSSSSSSESSSSSSSDSDCGRGKKDGMKAMMKRGKMEKKKWMRRRASMDVVSMLKAANSAVDTDPAVAEMAARMLSGLGRDNAAVIDVPAVNSTRQHPPRHFEAGSDGRVKLHSDPTLQPSPAANASAAVTERKQTAAPVEVAPEKTGSSVPAAGSLQNSVYGTAPVTERATAGTQGFDPRVRVSEAGHRVEVCMGKKCKQQGSEQILAQLQAQPAALGGLAVEASPCFKCMKQCKYAPTVRMEVGASGEASVVPVRDANDVVRLVREAEQGRRASLN